VLPWSQFGLDGYGLSIFASDAEIANHPDVVARFLAACEKGIQFSIANPEAAAKDLKAAVPIVDLEPAIVEVKTTIPVTKNEISDKYGMGTFNPALVQDTWKWIAKSQSYPLDKLDPEKVVNRSFVQRP
jgi:NitT/TauT family transport system substrate-binding protein